MTPNLKKHTGFTLIEVLLALAIVAIAFAALYKSISSNIYQTQRLKEKTIKHWVAMQGMTAIQLGLIELSPNLLITKKTRMFNQDWYWRITHQPAKVEDVDLIMVTVSSKATGPFTNPLYGFYYHPNENVSFQN